MIVCEKARRARRIAVLLGVLLLGPMAAPDASAATRCAPVLDIGPTGRDPADAINVVVSGASCTEARRVIEAWQIFGYRDLRVVKVGRWSCTTIASARRPSCRMGRARIRFSHGNAGHANRRVRSKCPRSMTVYPGVRFDGLEVYFLPCGAALATLRAYVSGDATTSWRGLRGRMQCEDKEDDGAEGGSCYGTMFAGRRLIFGVVYFSGSSIAARRGSTACGSLSSGTPAVFAIRAARLTCAAARVVLEEARDDGSFAPAGWTCWETPLGDSSEHACGRGAARIWFEVATRSPIRAEPTQPVNEGDDDLGNVEAG